MTDREYLEGMVDSLKRSIAVMEKTLTGELWSKTESYLQGSISAQYLILQHVEHHLKTSKES